MLQEKFGDDFPLRKTGNYRVVARVICILRTGSSCVSIECLLKHGVSLFETSSSPRAAFARLRDVRLLRAIPLILESVLRGCIRTK